MRKTILLSSFAAVAAGAFLFASTTSLRAGDESAKSTEPAKAGPKLDPALPAYEPVQDKLSGTLSAVGSDTMINIVTNWGEAFSKHYPNVKVQVEGKGSTTAPPALIEGASQIGQMSREMKATEINAFESKYGYKPTRLKTCLDALGVFVNKDNPLASLTVKQLDSIFSSTRKKGGDEITTWGQLGLGGEWADKPITLYGRNSASGTYSYFKEKILDKGDYKDGVKEQPGSAGVVDGVSQDKYGIGYSGIGYLTSGVKALGLSLKDGGTVYQPTLGNVMAEMYPLGRFLNVYINKAPNAPLSAELREYFKMVFSKEGQEIVAKEGFLPLSEKLAAAERAKVQ
jgi:phosphate transport system substrate-binding protein